MSLLEIAANAFTAVAIFLAGRNSIHTWAIVSWIWWRTLAAREGSASAAPVAQTL